MCSSRLSILLVDDDVMLCRGLLRSLRHQGFDAHAVHSATDAILFVQDHPVGLILLDWILPDRDGVTLLQDLRGRGIAAPVIMLTGENAVEDKVRALNRGADDYLAKPVAIEELIARVHAVVRRTSGASNDSSAPRVGRISVEPWKHEASVDGNRIDLTPIEYSILACLIHNADEVVSRRKLMEAVWTDKGVEGTSKALDVQLTRLRRKLGSAADQIKTVRGAGVCLHSGQELSSDCV